MKVLVFVLVISSWNSSRNEVEQFGYYATEQSCEKVRAAAPFKNFQSECVQVEIIK